MRLRTHEVQELDAAPARLAAETVVTRHLKVVDEAGNVRIDALVRDDHPDEAGPMLRVFGPDGAPLACLSIADRVRPTGGSVVSLFLSAGDEVASLQVGGMIGPSLDLEAPQPHAKGPLRLELLAGRDRAAFVTGHGPGVERTILQIVPGEEPQTLVDGDIDEETSP